MLNQRLKNIKSMLNQHLKNIESTRRAGPAGARGGRGRGSIGKMTSKPWQGFLRCRARPANANQAFQTGGLEGPPANLSSGRRRSSPTRVQEAGTHAERARAWARAGQGRVARGGAWGRPGCVAGRRGCLRRAGGAGERGRRSEGERGS